MIFNNISIYLSVAFLVIAQLGEKREPSIERAC
jgi:hypothetical protein